jgi:hypothetical protein
MKKTMIVAIAILAIVLGIVAYATADTQVATHDVTVNAKVNPRFKLTIVDASHALNLEADPDNPADAPVAISVQSNVAGTLSSSWSDLTTADSVNLTSDIQTVGTAVVKGTTNYTDHVKLAPGWTVSPVTLPALTLTYTAVQ